MFCKKVDIKILQNLQESTCAEVFFNLKSRVFSLRLYLSILAQCSISILSENVRKPKVFSTFSGSIELEHWAKIV